MRRDNFQFLYEGDYCIFKGNPHTCILANSTYAVIAPMHNIEYKEDGIRFHSYNYSETEAIVLRNTTLFNSIPDGLERAFDRSYTETNLAELCELKKPMHTSWSYFEDTETERMGVRLHRDPDELNKNSEKHMFLITIPNVSLNQPQTKETWELVCRLIDKGIISKPINGELKDQ